MAIAQAMKALYRRNAWVYPRLFSAQQRYLELLKSRLGYVDADDLEALPLLNLPARARCIDVGGGRGQTVTGLKRVLPGAQVLSFEPNPVTYVTLRQVADHFGNVATYNLGIGATEHETVMHIPHCAGLVFDQLAQTSPPNVAAVVRAIRGFGFTFAGSGNVTFERRTIRIKKLDNVPMAPDFIRVAVDGAELDVLRGAAGMLAQTRPALLIARGERAEIVSFLTAFGYLRCIYVDRTLSFGTRICAPNSFFVHEAHIPVSMYTKTH